MHAYFVKHFMTLSPIPPRRIAGLVNLSTLLKIPNPRCRHEYLKTIVYRSSTPNTNTIFMNNGGWNILSPFFVD